MFFKVFLLETYPFMNFLLYVFLEGPHQKYMQKMCVCYICSEMGHDRLSYIFCKQTRKSKVLSLSVVSDSEIPQIIARQVPLSMGFSRQEYWSGLPFPSPENLPDPAIQTQVCIAGHQAIWATREACKQTLYGTTEGINSIAKILKALKWARNKNLKPL